MTSGDITYDRRYGACASTLGWVPAPRYLLRRDLVLRELRCRGLGKVLEIGCGAGALLHDLSRLGFECAALETSPDALGIARTINADIAEAIQPSPLPQWRESFDFVLAFEVLEHIEEDVKALLEWKSYLRSGGRILISVPSDPDRWSVADDWAGHIRRYSRSDLASRLSQAGFDVVALMSYGFPLANLVEPLRIRAAKKAMEMTQAELDARKQTAQSGIERREQVRMFPLLTSPLGRLAMAAGSRVQRAFVHSNLGNGLLAIGARP